MNNDILFKDIFETEEKKELLDWINDYLDNYKVNNKNKWLYLYGWFGNGKSFIINALLNELKIKYNVTTEFIYFPDFIRFLKDNENEVDKKVDNLVNVDILCIDDLGSESVTSLSISVLKKVIEERNKLDKPVFITSNLSLGKSENELQKEENKLDGIIMGRFEDHLCIDNNDLIVNEIVDLLKNCCTIIELKGKNYRI